MARPVPTISERSLRGVLTEPRLSETLSRMEGEDDACGDLDPENKTLSAYQAVSERLAMTARLDGARVPRVSQRGVRKTVTSAACIDAFTGSGRTSTSSRLKTIFRRAWSCSARFHSSHGDLKCKFRDRPRPNGERPKKAGLPLFERKVGKAEGHVLCPELWGVRNGTERGKRSQQVRRKGEVCKTLVATATDTFMTETIVGLASGANPTRGTTRKPRLTRRVTIAPCATRRSFSTRCRTC